MLENSDKKQTRVSKEHNATSPKLSVTSVACRICYESEKVEELVAPCYCKGSVAYVHRSCLDQWLSESGTTNCELCHQMFRREKLAKTNHFRSICHWLKNGPRSPEQGVRVHIIACTVITPLAIIVVTYIVCMYYSQQKFSEAVTRAEDERNSSVSLLTVIGIILIGYYLWVYAVTRLHARWQRSCIIRYIPRNLPEDQTVLVPIISPPNRVEQESSSNGDGDDSMVITINKPSTSSHTIPCIL